jgi:peptidoglycan hydrolase-like protein with peptidoglycan-binding domain
MSLFRKGFVGAVLALSLLAVSVPAQASSLTSSQVSAIIGLLQSFGADSATISNVSAALGAQTPTPTGGYSPTNCPVLSRNLVVGLQGTDVTSLQNFLITQGYLATGNNTGYFGSLTQQAVQKWQGAHSISTVGSVGPQTRAAMGCGNTTTQSVQTTNSTNSGTSITSGTSALFSTSPVSIPLQSHSPPMSIPQARLLQLQLILEMA